MARIAVDLGRRPARWQSTNACGADPCMSPSVTPEYAGCDERSLPLDERSSPPRSRPSTTSRSAAPATKSATTASTEMPQPAIAIPVCPVGTNSERDPARAGLAVELERDRHLPDRAVRADGQHDRAVDLEVRAGRHVEAGRRAPEIASARRRCRRRARRAPGSSETNSCSPFSIARPCREAARGAARATRAGSGRPGSRPRRARPSGGTRSAASTSRDDRDAAARSRPRVSSRGSRRRRRGGSAAPRASSCRSADRAEKPSARIRSPPRLSADTEPGLVARAPARRRRRSRRGTGSSRSSRLPSRSTWSQSGATTAAGGDPESRLDHAAEHHPEPERAGRVGHPDRLADPARLRELDVDPVRDLGAAGDVGERVAVLVDVDRERRARPQLGPRRDRRPAAAARRTATPSSASCGIASSASSSDHHSFTSTCSGRSVTARTARTRSTSRPSPPPSLSFSRLKRRATRSARRAMSSGSPSQIVHDVGGPTRGSPSSRQTGTPSSLPWRSWSAASSAAFAACSPGISASRRADLLERERVVAEQRPVLLDERERRLAASRRSGRSAPPRRGRRRPPCRDLDLDDVRRSRAPRGRSRTSRRAAGGRSGRSTLTPAAYRGGTVR